MENLVNSSDKLLTTVDYTYRFLYNDTLQKGTASEQIMEGRVCEVLFYKNVEKIDQDGMTGFRTTLTYDQNSVLKAGPTGSVSKQMLFKQFENLIQKDQLSKLWVYMTISDAATISPKGDAPTLGEAGDFTNDQIYTVRAADGSSQDYLIETVKGF
ncbi:hypothetical protein GCM10027566_00130 [Arachidicoccus ginsenosidivorans]